MNKAVFLDRDGVLNAVVLRNGKPYPPEQVTALSILPGVAEALIQLRDAGYRRIVVTNQPDIARGKTQWAVVEAMHAYLKQQLVIDEIYMCPHDDQHACDCRKPKPGLLLSAAAQYQLSLDQCYMVGDRWRDIEAGQAAGCKTIWLDQGYDERGPKHPPDCIVRTLPEAVSWIFSNEEG